LYIYVKDKFKILAFCALLILVSVKDYSGKFETLENSEYPMYVLAHITVRHITHAILSTSPAGYAEVLDLPEKYLCVMNVTNWVLGTTHVSVILFLFSIREKNIQTLNKIYSIAHTNS
jgi:hypothetical protein